MKNARLLALLPALLIPATANAKPVTWPDGYQIMMMNDQDSNAVHLMYTVTPHLSLQNRTEYMRATDTLTAGLQANYLIHRWNLPGAQANIYGGLGAGYARNPDDGESFAGFGNVLADYETRRVFVSYEGDGITAGDVTQQFWHRTRVGVAPYEGEYDDVHTWLMLQTDYRPDVRNEWSVTPMVRLFKTNWMVEGGISNRGEGMFNVILQF